MTVGKLVKKLRKYSKNTRVLIHDQGSMYIVPLTDIWERKTVMSGHKKCNPDVVLMGKFGGTEGPSKDGKGDS